MNKLIVINRSLGELDWIVANYSLITSDLDRITILCYRVDQKSVLNFAPNFFGDNEVTVLSVEQLTNSFRLLRLVDNFFDRSSTYLFNKFGSAIQYKFDSSLVFVKGIVSYVFRLPHTKLNNIDKIYHENNDRTTCLLELIKRKREFKSLEFFPHHFGATQPINRMTLNIQDKVGIDSCFVNFEDESKIGNYKFLGSSIIERSNRTDGELKILILTRQCSESFGFSYENAYEKLDVLLSKLKRYGIEIYIKNHPRDLDNHYWNKLIRKYNLITIEYSAIDFVRKNKVVCFHLHTTLCIPLSQLKALCYDVSPYVESLIKNNESVLCQIKKQSELMSTVILSDVINFDFDRVLK